MLLDHQYAFGLLLKPTDQKKKFLNGGAPVLPSFAHPGSTPEQIWPKATTLLRDHEYFMNIKFHQNPSGGFVIKADYVFQYIHMH